MVRNTNRSWVNRSNNDRGKLFERLVDQACWHYKEKGIAMIEKTPEPFRVVRKNKDGSLTVYPTGLAQPDYKGTLRGGRAIAFEAKMTTTERIKKDVVTVHQAACLDEHAKLGAIVGVCCMIKKTVAFVPWQIWREMQFIYGRKYMTEKEITEYAVSTPGYIDFLMNLGSDVWGD